MINKKFIRRQVPEEINLPASIHPVLRRVLATRDVSSEADIDYSLAALLPFNTLSGLDKAVSLLKAALENQRRILVVADFDTDGATACALAIRGLTMMGLEDICYIVPNRFEYGYGLSPEIVDVALDYAPDLLMTVDNGISSIAGVAHAKSNGLKVLITDHHLPGKTLPEADAIINPQLSGDQFPGKSLAGVGVVFYLLLALRADLKESQWFDNKNIDYPNLAHLLDLVALGTVADLVPLDKNNRIMVAHGLKLIRQEKTVPGILALLRQGGRSLSNLSSADLGFAVAPRLNAAGRITDMSLGIECLISDDMQAVKKMAEELDTLNRERRQIQDEMEAQALFVLESIAIENLSELSHGICLYRPDWHQGVIGILAAKIKERFNQPAIAFAGDMAGVIKGSARSITGLHIRDLLEEIARLHPELILSFGGHAMAAGLTIKEASFRQFADCFSAILKTWMPADDMRNNCITDGELSTPDISLALAEAIQVAGPWGQAFPEPLFEGRFRILDKWVVGRNHLRFRLRADDKVINAIAFNMDDGDDCPATKQYCHMVYRLGINDYCQERQLQLFIEHMQAEDK